MDPSWSPDSVAPHRSAAALTAARCCSIRPGRRRRARMLISAVAAVSLRKAQGRPQDLTAILSVRTLQSQSSSLGEPTHPKPPAGAFVMLARLHPDAVRSPSGLEQLECNAMKRVREECPDVQWLSSYAVLGPYDYLDTCGVNAIPAGLSKSAVAG